MRQGTQPALLAALVALGGCMATPRGPAPPTPAVPGHAVLPGTAAAPAVPQPRWWQGLGDSQLTSLIETALAPGNGQDHLAGDIARHYIDWRARQTALVLLARREELDAQLVAITQQSSAGAAPPQSFAEAQAQLAATQAEQARVRAEIAALRTAMATLVSPAAIDSLPGGPIPLPPRDAAVADASGLLARRYDAARTAEAAALSNADHARASAAIAEISARAGTLAPAAAVAADRQALDALQAEEQARAALTHAYVELAQSLDRARAGR